MRLKGYLCGAALAGLGLLTAASPTRADSIQLTISAASPTEILVGPNTGDYLWTYTVGLTGSASEMNSILNATQSASANTALKSGQPAEPTVADFFTMYDVYGLVPGSVTSTGLVNTSFTLTTPNTSPASYHQTVTDSTSLPNIVFTYTGSVQLNGGSTGLALGTFSFVSKSGNTGSSQYVGEDHNSTNLALHLDSVEGNFGNVAAPAAPAPASLWGGLALFGLVGGFGLRRRLTQTA